MHDSMYQNTTYLELIMNFHFSVTGQWQTEFNSLLSYVTLLLL